MTSSTCFTQGIVKPSTVTTSVPIGPMGAAPTVLSETPDRPRNMFEENNRSNVEIPSLVGTKSQYDINRKAPPINSHMGMMRQPLDYEVTDTRADAVLFPDETE